MTVTLTCARCGAAKPLEDFAKDKRKRLGRAYACKACEHARDKAYCAKPEIRARHAIMARERYWVDPDEGRSRRSTFRTNTGQSYQRDPVKEIARRALSSAVRSGRIKRPEICELCGASGRIHGHHEDYSKPLEVRWLCQPCHGAVHRKYLTAALSGGAK